MQTKITCLQGMNFQENWIHKIWENFWIGENNSSKNWQTVFKDYSSLTYLNSCEIFELSFFMKTSSCENYTTSLCMYIINVCLKKIFIKISVIYELISNAYQLTGISIKILTEMYSRQKLVPLYTANKRKKNIVIFVCDTHYFF